MLPLKHLFGRGEIAHHQVKAAPKSCWSGHHAFEIFCVLMRFEPYVLACLELREMHAYMFGFLDYLQAIMNFRFVEGVEQWKSPNDLVVRTGSCD